jgi:hypothetical protein
MEDEENDHLELPDIEAGQLIRVADKIGVVKQIFCPAQSFS